MTSGTRAPAGQDVGVEANSVKISHPYPTDDIDQTYWVYGANFERGNIIFLAKTEAAACTARDTLRVLVSLSANSDEDAQKVLSYLLTAYAENRPIKAELVRFSRTNYNKDMILEHSLVRLASIPESELKGDMKPVDLQATLGGAHFRDQLSPGRLSHGKCVDRDSIKFK